MVYPTNNIMLDIETLGISSNAAIISIGAVKFNLETFTIGDEFYQIADLKSSMDLGLEVDAETILWWMGQSEEAKAVFKDSSLDIKTILYVFSDWLTINPIIWGNGAVFDNVILSNAYKKASMKRPWSYKNDYCYRTIRSLYPEIEMKEIGIHHNALDDARNQANHLIEIFKVMRGKGLK